MSLLEQAIIDAQELKEAALKSAESAILEKYSFDIKEAVDAMLGQEEEDLMMGGIPEEETLPEEEIPYAADAEVKLCPCPDDEEEITISFDQLQTMAGEMGDEGAVQAPEESLAMAMGAEEEEEEEIPMMESIDLDELLEACGDMMPMDSMEHPMEHEEEGGDVKNITINLEEIVDLEDVASDMAMDDADMKSPTMGAGTEDFEFDDDDLDVDLGSLEEMVREALTVDMASTPSGWDSHLGQGAPSAVQEFEEDLDLAKAAETIDEEDKNEIRLAEAKKAIVARDAQIKDLKEKLQTLVGSSAKLKQTFMLVREQFEETNLSNAKLLYTNRTLMSTSLNERQKNRIVESIRDADTIEEAKVIYETLQSAVGGPRKSAPKSLNEAIKRPSISAPRRRRDNSAGDSLAKDRFQTLAGIKK
jgi:hypothetical protein